MNMPQRRGSNHERASQSDQLCRSSMVAVDAAFELAGDRRSNDSVRHFRGLEANDTAVALLFVAGCAAQIRAASDFACWIRVIQLAGTAAPKTDICEYTATENSASIRGGRSRHELRAGAAGA